MGNVRSWWVPLVVIPFEIYEPYMPQYYISPSPFLSLPLLLPLLLSPSLTLSPSTPPSLYRERKKEREESLLQ